MKARWAHAMMCVDAQTAPYQISNDALQQRYRRIWTSPAVLAPLLWVPDCATEMEAWIVISNLDAITLGSHTPWSGAAQVALEA